MAISGNAREVSEHFSSYKVGLGVFDVIDINPDKKRLGEFFGRDQEKDPVYVSKDNDNNTLVNLDIWLQEDKTAQKFRLRMMLINKAVTSKAGKVKFIDNKGNTSYFLDSEDNLAGWMQQNDPWQARVGEVELYKFARAHQGKLFGDQIKEFVLDWNRLMRGDVSELNELRENLYATKILALAAVKVDRKDGEMKEYQQIYNGAFLPGEFMRYFRNNGAHTNKKLVQFIHDATSEEHGCKNFFGKNRKLLELHDYNPADNPLRTDEAVLSEQSQDMDEEDLSSDY